MDPSLIILAGGLFILAIGLHGLNVSRRDARLGARLTSIALPGNPTAIRTADSEGRWDKLFLCSGKDHEEVVTALRGAGLYSPSNVTRFAAFRFFGTLGTGLIVYLLLSRSAHPSHFRFIYVAMGAAAVFLLSKFALRSQIAAHLRQVGKELPFLLDTLLLLLESGVSIDQAFRYFAQANLGGLPLTQRAVAALVQDIQNGVPYAIALDRWADRLGVAGTKELASLFKQALLQGSELGPALHDFVREFSDKRLSSARASIGKKTTQMTVVMIMFLMPALMIVLAGPAVVAVQGVLKGPAK